MRFIVNCTVQYRRSDNQGLILTRLLDAGAKADADARHKAAIAAVNFILVQLMCSIYKTYREINVNIKYTKLVYVWVDSAIYIVMEQYDIS